MTRCGLHIVVMYGLFIWNADVFFCRFRWCTVHEIELSFFPMANMLIIAAQVGLTRVGCFCIM